MLNLDGLSIYNYLFTIVLFFSCSDLGCINQWIYFDYFKFYFYNL